MDGTRLCVVHQDLTDEYDTAVTPACGHSCTLSIHRTPPSASRFDSSTHDDYLDTRLALSDDQQHHAERLSCTSAYTFK